MLKMDKSDRLVEIMETYERFRNELEARGLSFGEAEGGGFWTPTTWSHLRPFLEYATSKDIMTPPGTIVDAGSGDGRVSAFLDVYGFNPIVNIELDNRLFKASQEVIDGLVQRNVINGNISTVQGDFTQSEAYAKACVPFESVAYFYTGINPSPTKRLAEKIARESPEGTKLIVYGPSFSRDEEPEIFLRLEDIFTPPPSTTIKKWDYGTFFSRFSYLH